MGWRPAMIDNHADPVSMFRAFAAVQMQDLYLRRQDALDFVEACDEQDIAVYRVEAFVVQGRAACTSTGMIADFPSVTAGELWVSHRSECNAFARNFINDATPYEPTAESFKVGGADVAEAEMLFAFVLERRDESPKGDK